MKFWGVTGTNGKTTTTWIFAEFVNACPGRKCGYLTTVEVNTGARRFYTGYTTPPLGQLKEIFAEMEANGCTDCVMEVSSHAIHQHRTGDTVFAGGAFTNLSEDHLDYHKTMEAYFDVKLDFARQIAEQRENRAAEREHDHETKRVSEAERAKARAPYVVCLDGGYGREMFNAVGNLAVNVIPAGLSLADAVRPSPVDAVRPSPVDAVSHRVTSGKELSFSDAERLRVYGDAERLRVYGAYDLSQLPLVGDYNKSNVLTAAALAEAAGVPHDVIQRVIPTLKPRWGRLELVENPRVKATVYVDFAHTPDGLEKVLAAVRGTMGEGVRHETGDASGDERRKTGDLWVVFGAGGDRDPMKRPLMGAACARLADRLVVTSDNPRSEDPMKIIDAIVAGIPVDAVRPSPVDAVRPSPVDAVSHRVTSGKELSFSDAERLRVYGDAVRPSPVDAARPSPVDAVSHRVTSGKELSSSDAERLRVYGDAERLRVYGDAERLRVYGDAANHRVYVEPDRAKAIAYALAGAQAGDVVVIAGKGHETTQEIAGVKYPFDDRAVVRGF